MDVSAGKEDPVEFDSSLMLCSGMEGVAQVGDKCHGKDLKVEVNLQPTVEDADLKVEVNLRRDGSWCKPAVKYHYLHRRFTHRVTWERQP